MDKKIIVLIAALNAEGGLCPGRNNNNDDDGDVGTSFAEGKADENEVATMDKNNKIHHRLYCYGGKFHHLLESFQLPSDLKLDTGWKLLMGGNPDYKMTRDDGTTERAPMRPYHLLNPRIIATELAKDFNLKFCPIYRLMEKARGIIFTDSIEELDSKYFESTFQIGRDFLRTRLEYIF